MRTSRVGASMDPAQCWGSVPLAHVGIVG
ncbi:MAG: hypothetical protein JWO22_812, partial [Frankiales bacterium]|nr:hypothetical protein [Frankiales bacterium]